LEKYSLLSIHGRMELEFNLKKFFTYLERSRRKSFSSMGLVLSFCKFNKIHLILGIGLIYLIIQISLQKFFKKILTIQNVNGIGFIALSILQLNGLKTKDVTGITII